jgi:hypothetical protein
MLAVYRHTAADPIEQSAVFGSDASRGHPSPLLSGLSASSYAVGYWSAVSKDRVTWRGPHASHRRAAAIAGTLDVDSALLVDRRASGRFLELGVAKTSKSVSAAAQWALALRPALH